MSSKQVVHFQFIYMYLCYSSYETKVDNAFQRQDNANIGK